jgi:hypothetical protein
MNINLSLVNWPAVLVAGVAAFVLGGIWYQALFGKLWIRMQGWSEQTVAEMKAKTPMAMFLGGMFACYLILAVAVELLVVALDLTTAQAGAFLGAILWLGPAAAIGFTSHLASNRRTGVYLIDAAFQFVALIAQGILLAVWR